jgi:hypothetical protein
MVAPFIAIGCVALAASSGLLFQQLAKPRLPVYTLNVRGLPWLEWGVQGELHTVLPTRVALHNDNFVQIDVHGLTFDMFYMGWDGELRHIGRIQDSFLSGLEPNATLSWRASRRKPLQKVAPNIWQIGPRADFVSSINLYVECFLSRLYGAVSRLLWSAWKGGGSIVLPTTGVAYIKANSATPFTVSIICDNLVNTWTLQVQGMECALKQLKPGWSLSAIDAVRDYALVKLRANETGGVLDHPYKTSWEDVIERIAVEEVLQHP